MIRNYNLEKDIITAAIADRKVANMLHRPNELQKLMPVVEDNGDAVTADGQLRIYRNSYTEIEMLPSIQANMETSQLVQNGQWCENRCTAIINGVETVVVMGGWLPALRLLQFPNSGYFEQDISVGVALSSSLKVNGNWSSNYTPDSGHWRSTNQQLPVEMTYKLNDINHICRGEFIILFNGSNYLVLPVTLYRNVNVQKPFVAFIPPSRPRCFLNENWLRHYPHATIVLTPNILDAINHQQNPNQIVMANLGHAEWLDSLDYSVLVGRNVVIIDDGAEGPYTIALIEKLQSHNLNIVAVEQQLVNNGTHLNTQTTGGTYGC